MPLDGTGATILTPSRNDDGQLELTITRCRRAGLPITKRENFPGGSAASALAAQNSGEHRSAAGREWKSTARRTCRDRFRSHERFVDDGRQATFARACPPATCAARTHPSRTRCRLAFGRSRVARAADRQWMNQEPARGPIVRYLRSNAGHRARNRSPPYDARLPCSPTSLRHRRSHALARARRVQPRGRRGPRPV